MIEQLITDHLDLWSSAVRPKSSAGRGSNSKLELTGIKKLRELILELAVRGMLVPQDPNDEPASVLLERIAAEKARRVKEGKIKKSKPLPEITDEEKPFELPEGWEWTSLGNVVAIVRGITFPASEKYIEPSEGKIACLRTANVQDLIDWDDLLYVDKSFVKRQEQCAEIGDIVMSMANSRELVGKVAYISSIPTGDATFGGFLSVIRPYEIDATFLMAILRAPQTRSILIDSSSQTTNIANISLEKLNPLAVAIPPLAEQHRIVAKVDKLMSLCDQLEQQSEASLAAHQTLVETLLATLTESADVAELAQNWARLAQHFDSLFTTQSSIDALKQTILQLAVMGKLVPQDPSDEPASVLLERIAAEKARLVKEGKIKKEKPLPPISEEEKLFRIPDSWCFCRLGDICDGITSGSTPPKEKFSHDEGVPFLKVYNIRDQKIDFDYEPQFVEKDYNDSKLKRSMLYPGDVVMNIVGPPLGKVAIIPSNFPVWNCNQAIVFFRPIDMGLNKHIYTYLKAGLFLASIELIGTAGQDNISVTKSRLIVLPMPPLKEQLRIADRIEQLLSLCDQLSARLQASQTTQLHLAEALVEGALN